MTGCRWGFRFGAMLSGAILAGLVSGAAFAGGVGPPQGGEVTMKVGDRLPGVTLTGAGGTRVRLADSVGRIAVISVVPQLNTPVCDEQTHRFSERNGGLDRVVEFVTISTNIPEDQARFAAKAGISNMRFLSDAPSYGFGKQTGLLLPLYGVLHRAVLVVDADAIIRYLQLVPMGELPNFEAALEAARRLARVP